ncbi:MAG: beta-lactamase family protein [Roseivirga sp.]|nr:beta-lactamase family protein [Roseivirga sp.]
MNRSIIPFLLIVSIVFWSCNGQPHQSTVSQKQLIAHQVDSLVSVYQANREFSGAVLVADNSGVLINKEYGYTSLDSTHLIDQASVFEIASISKQFTAMLIMMLKEEGKLSYEDNILNYFPGLPYKDITIRHLLTHTSGIAERPFFMWGAQNMDRSKVYHNEIVLQYLEQQKPPLSFNPGEKWEYSNVGYFLLAMILQETTGKHYITLLHEKILDPLGMTSTAIYSEQYKGNEMEQYVFGKLYDANSQNFRSSFGMSWSTDLLKWEQALTADQLVNQRTLEEAFTAHQLTDNSSAEYGFGWYVREHFTINGIDRGKRLDHNGLWPGYESSIVRYPASGKTIIVLANQAPSAKDKLLEEISALLFPAKAEEDH